jgi:hypothetical protein
MPLLRNKAWNLLDPYNISRVIDAINIFPASAAGSRREREEKASAERFGRR